MFELLFVFVVAITTGYQAGKAGQKQIAIENGGYCVRATIETDRCFEVKEVTAPKRLADLKSKE